MMRRVLIGLALSALVLVLATHDDLNPDRLPRQGTCQEDEPCWDCKTMGNRVCGTSTDKFCWYEWNAEMPNGVEVICGTAAQEREAERFQP